MTQQADSLTSRPYSDMDDFEIIEERRRVQLALATLTDTYRALNTEMDRRETLRWMTAPHSGAR